MPKTLLVVDDSATMRKVFEMTFAGEDITVVAHDGSDSLLARAREAKPSLAVVDVALNGRAGYDVCRMLKADAALGALPVLLLFSEHTPLDEGRAREAGADGSLAKPFDTQGAIDKVRQAMSGVAGGVSAPATSGAMLHPYRGQAPPAVAGSTMQGAGGPAPQGVGAPIAPGAASSNTTSGSVVTRPPVPAAVPARSPGSAGVGSVGGAPPAGAAASGNLRGTQLFAPGAATSSQSPTIPARPAAPPMAAAPKPVAPPGPARPVAPPVPPPAAPGPRRSDSGPMEVVLGGGDDELTSTGDHEVPVLPPAPAPVAAKPAAPVAPAPPAAMTAISAEVSQRAAALGLTPAQVDAVAALTREVVERVVWEVVPQLAETMIREEIRRLTAG